MARYRRTRHPRMVFIGRGLPLVIFATTRGPFVPPGASPPPLSYPCPAAGCPGQVVQRSFTKRWRCRLDKTHDYPPTRFS